MLTDTKVLFENLREFIEWLGENEASVEGYDHDIWVIRIDTTPRYYATVNPHGEIELEEMARP